MALPARIVKTDRGNIVLARGFDSFRARFPPVVTRSDTLGYLQDRLKNDPRGGGRSAVIAEHAFYTFQDQTCFSYDGSNLWNVSNTVATVVNPDDPLASAHLSVRSDGLVSPFITLTEAEEYYQWQSGNRILLRPGGMCPVIPCKRIDSQYISDRDGYVWFSKFEVVTKPDGSKQEVFLGTGAATVIVDRETGEMEARRILGDALLFSSHQPSFGTFSAIAHEDWYYLFGKRGEDVFLARTPAWAPLRRDLMEFWNGYAYEKDISSVMPVLSGQKNGVFLRSRLFGHTHPWVFVGNTRWDGDNHIIIGGAPRLEGPFELCAVTTAEPLYGPSQQIDGVLVHQWASHEREGRLFLTWNQKHPRTVVGANIWLEMEHAGAFWVDISLEELPVGISGLAKFDNTLRNFALSRNVMIEFNTSKDGKATIRLASPKAPVVNDVAAWVAEKVKEWCVKPSMPKVLAWKAMEMLSGARKCKEEGIENKRPAA